ncbi:methyl-accepting chemotaxis protein [uncultured Tateyamaria sp.]|uniref:methyl-accepting chemotaxis protein n=2 Tax=uncultured Tateyamaria sp. TaxID=455651 RepID=UPI002625D2D7|nr:methyl-accepting chemotaxis protein [uncultured Tateyamaria sp.]
MNMQSRLSDVTDVLGQQAGATGITACIELLRAVEMIRSHCARVGLYCAAGMLFEGEEDHDACVAGVDRALPGAWSGVRLLQGAGNDLGIDPQALAWLHSVVADMPDSVAQMERFVTVIDGLARKNAEGNCTPADLRAMTQIAAGDFNLHFARLVNRLSADLQDARATRRNAVQKTGDDTRQALREISEISQNVGLIAINASIEAAHVGEQGRGFAIIAAEIRELSEKIELANAQVQTQVDAMIRKMIDD